MANSDKMENPPEISSNLALLYRSVYTSEPIQPLPTSWRSKDRSAAIRISPSGLAIVCTGEAQAQRSNSSSAPSLIRSDHPVPFRAGIYYYETKVCAIKPNCVLVFGFSTKSASKLAGWDSNCYGLDNSGSLYRSPLDTLLSPNGFKDNDVIGCGVNFLNKSFFFTKNGQFLGNAFEGSFSVSGVSEVYPVMIMEGQGCRVTTNFGEKPFLYPFLKHIIRERFVAETELVESLSKDFVEVKMRDLVAGYLVHHGYIESASSFSRWTNLSESASSPKKTRCDTDAAAENGTQSGDLEQKSFPGIGSMQHRRSLRSFCQRCKFGLVASTLNALYPKIVERYPELILQLRCRQLIEMMHRHSVRLSGHVPTPPSNDSKLLFHQHTRQQREEGRGSTTTSRKRPCTNTDTASSTFCVCTSEFVPTLATCGDANSHTLSGQLVHGLANQFKKRRIEIQTSAQHSHGLAPSAATPCDAMDIDNSSMVPESTSDQASLDTPQLPSNSLQVKFHATTNGTKDVKTGDTSQNMVCDFPDDDDDENDGPNGYKPVPMDTGILSDAPRIPSAACSSLSLSALSGEIDKDQEYLMRQISFSRSLMDLARDVELKCGSISPETDRLLHDSVCLMAYEKPSDPDCPLRCLLDSAYRDNIASLINSAILTEEHNLPPQPAIEKALYKLERYLVSTDHPQCQSLAYFLLYHLNPSKYREEMNQLRKSKQQKQDSTTNGSSNPLIEGTNIDNSCNNNGKNNDESFQSIEHPRGAHRYRRSNHGIVSSNGNTTYCSSSVSPNGRISPPKRRITLRSNGASRRRYWRTAATVSASTEEDEEEVEGFSMEEEGEGVQIHRHEELEDDSEMNVQEEDDDDDDDGDGDAGSPADDGEDEAEVELMTASMEEDGFEDLVGEEDEEEDSEEAEGEQVAYDPEDVEEVQEEDDMLQFAQGEGWSRLTPSRNQDARSRRIRTMPGTSSGSSHHHPESSTESLLAYISRPPRYARNTVEDGAAADNFWPRVNLLYSPRASRQSGSGHPSSSSSSGGTSSNHDAAGSANQ